MYDVFSETQIFVLANNLRCFDETDVRTSQKTTYAQFKIYRTNFIDEVGPRCRTVFRENSWYILHGCNNWASSRQNLSSGFPTKRVSNQSPQLHMTIAVDLGRKATKKKKKKKKEKDQLEN